MAHRLDRRLLGLTALAVVLAIGHHIDHAIRGNHVGWPLTEAINAFTFSLGIYPAIGVGLLLYLAGRVGPGFWAFLSGGGAAFLAYVHFGPQAIEPPEDIIHVHASPVVGWLAFGWLLALVARSSSRSPTSSVNGEPPEAPERTPSRCLHSVRGLHRRAA